MNNYLTFPLTPSRTLNNQIIFLSEQSLDNSSNNTSTPKNVESWEVVPLISTSNMSNYQAIPGSKDPSLTKFVEKRKKDEEPQKEDEENAILLTGVKSSRWQRFSVLIGTWMNTYKIRLVVNLWSIGLDCRLSDAPFFIRHASNNYYTPWDKLIENANEKLAIYAEKFLKVKQETDTLKKIELFFYISISEFDGKFLGYKMPFASLPLLMTFELANLTSQKTVRKTYYKMMQKWESDLEEKFRLKKEKRDKYKKK